MSTLDHSLLAARQKDGDAPTPDDAFAALVGERLFEVNTGNHGDDCYIIAPDGTDALADAYELSGRADNFAPVGYDDEGWFDMAWSQRAEALGWVATQVEYAPPLCLVCHKEYGCPDCP